MQEPILSSYGQLSLTPSPVAAMMADFSRDFRPGLDINLGVGYVNEETIPRQLISDSLNYVLQNPDKHPHALNYGDPAGSARLIKSIGDYLIREKIGQLTCDILDTKRIIVGANGATSVLDALASVLPKGIVITTDPIYFIYSNALERAGFEILALPEDDHGLDPQIFRKTIDSLGPRTEEISFIYIITVNNPTSVILSSSRKQQLVTLAAELSQKLNRKVPIIFDRAYEDLIHDPEVPEPDSALLHDRHDLAYELSSLSKTLAPAFRLGYLVGPRGPLMDTLIQKASDIGFSAPLILQEMAAYLLDHHLTDQIGRVKKAYREKALATKKLIETHLGPHLEDCRGGQAGFFYYLTLNNTDTTPGSPFFRYLSRTTGNPEIDGPANCKAPRVVYIPGQFCVHRHGSQTHLGQRQIRISYAFEELPQIQAALPLIAQALSYAQESSQRSQRATPMVK